MKSSRREFILKSGAAAAALGLGMSYANSSTNKKIKKAKKSLKIQIFSLGQKVCCPVLSFWVNLLQIDFLKLSICCFKIKMLLC